MKIYNAFLCLLLILLSSCSLTQKTPWENLIKDNTLNNWSVKGGKSTYKVVDGAIIGNTVKNEANTF